MRCYTAARATISLHPHIHATSTCQPKLGRIVKRGFWVFVSWCREFWGVISIDNGGQVYYQMCAGKTYLRMRLCLQPPQSLPMYLRETPPPRRISCNGYPAARYSISYDPQLRSPEPNTPSKTTVRRVEHICFCDGAASANATAGCACHERSAHSSEYEPELSSSCSGPSSYSGSSSSSSSSSCRQYADRRRGRSQLRLGV